MKKFWKKHRKEILSVVAALIVPGGFVILTAGMLKKYFGR